MLGPALQCAVVVTATLEAVSSLRLRVRCPRASNSQVRQRQTKPLSKQGRSRCSPTFRTVPGCRDSPRTYLDW